MSNTTQSTGSHRNGNVKGSTSNTLPSPEAHADARKAAKNRKRSHPNPTQAAPARGAGAMQARDKREYEKAQQRDERTLSFLAKHVTLATATKQFADLTGVAKAAAEYYMDIYQNLRDKDCKTPQGLAVKRGVLAATKTTVEACTDTERANNAQDIQRGISCARRALKATYDVACGKPVDEEKAENKRPTGQAFIEVHAKLAGDDEFVTTLEGLRREAAVKFLEFYVTIKTSELAKQGNAKQKRVDKAAELTDAHFACEDETRTGHVKYGILVARKAITRTYKVASGEKPATKPAQPAVKLALPAGVNPLTAMAGLTRRPQSVSS